MQAFRTSDQHQSHPRAHALPQRQRVEPFVRYPASLVDRIDLPDGRSVAMRPMFAADADAEQAFVKRLSPDSRQRRFHLGIPELAPDMLRMLTDVDQVDHVAVVAETQDEDGVATIVADARYVRTGMPGEAEFAMTVADEWQGRGLGLALMQRLLDHARRHGIGRLYGDVLRANAPMIGLVRRLGGKLGAVPGDGAVTRAVFALR